MKTNIFATSAALVLLSQAAHSVTVNSTSLTSGDFTMQPPVLTARETPLVMLGLSVDNQLFYKAYSDYTDIDSDGQLETGYEDTFDYYGYFDSNWCYNYDATNNVFSPASQAAGANGHSCLTGATDWSGNFLNWATMTRIDVLRRVLYGGLRSTDTGSSTVLERAYIPSDVHAFAKVYDGADIADFTPYTPGTLKDGALTLCNVSSAHPYSSTSVPELRLAKGNYRRWSINESKQCQWGSGANRPDTTDQLNNGSELVVRVRACVASKDASSDNCRIYGSASKPAGLLQQYGEGGDLKFGLISGGYENYIAGGRLRKNIGLIGSNSNAADDEVNLTDGTFNSVDGIISTIDSLKIIGWSGSGYGCGGPGISITNFKNKSNPCRDWGNPIAEIYAEAVRYFSGATSKTASYTTGSDTTHIAALKEATWPSSLSVNPLNTDTRCAACSIIMISSGVASFDGDDLSEVDDIEGLSSVSDLSAETNAVGTAEYGTFPLSLLVGEAGASNNLICTPKAVSNLSVALGICPEAPALEGSYQIAGLASHAKTTDLREDTGMEGDQLVDTYGVELAESVPSFDIQVGSGTVRFLPACQSASKNSNNWIPCSLFDVEVIQTETDSSGNLISGTLIFHWEDSSWGSDYDLDGSQVIQFCVGGSDSDCDDANNDTRTGATYDDVAVADDRLRISQAVAYTAAGFDIRFGYVVTGSTDDGISDWLLRPGGQNRNDLCQLTDTGAAGNPYLPVPTKTAYDATSCGTDSQTTRGYLPESEVYQASSSGGGKLLDKPLFLAAKYGGFTDRDGSGDPTYGGTTTDTREWDLVNNRTGDVGADGIPDNYFFSSNPGLLVDQLQRIFEALVARTASGTNAAVVANSSSGVGAVYQALYQPQFTVGSNTVNWTGSLRAIFIDDAGRLREDSNSNDQLDGLDVDKTVQLEFDPSVEKTFVQRYVPDSNGDLVPDGTQVELKDLKPIWSAVDALAQATSPEVQRSYAGTGLTTRHILTAMDRNLDGEVDQQDVVGFTGSAMGSSYSDYYEYFGLPASTGVDTLIEYLRGKEVSGLRNRTIDYDEDGTDEVWRLGDIIHSTPAVVATPDGNYDRLYSDDTYEGFVDKYRNRRQVIYVGANDGMIHAFNGGFWDAANRKFNTTSTGKVTRPLGQEMWAYVPTNLLPHMRWLAEVDYQHVYFMDGEPVVFDANVFDDDTTHPGGWGTIMVMGMRFGGSPLQISVDSSSQVMRSAYVLFDVTDPEQPPKLLGEVTAPELGFTLSKPAVVKNRQPDATTGDWSSPSVNDWYLVLGSGPKGTNARSDAVSDQTPRLFAIDLEQLVDNASTATSTGASYFATIGGGNPLDLGGDDGFVSGLEVKDWDQNNSEDAVYVSTIEGTSATPTGRLLRLLIDDNDGSTQSYKGVSGADLGVLMNPARPIQAAATTVRDSFGERWLLFGTGKLLVPSDNDLQQQEYFYGIKEPRDSSGELTYGSVDPSNLVDTTDIAVFETAGEVKDISSGSVADLTIGGESVGSFSELESELRDYPGWKIRMEKPTGVASGRVTNKATLNPANRESFGFTAYLPPAESCELDGESFLYALSILTGTSTPEAPLATTNEYVVNSNEMSQSVVSIGAGYASSITFHQGAAGTLNAITNMSTGAINTTEQNVAVPASGRQSWRQIESISF